MEKLWTLQVSNTLNELKRVHGWLELIREHHVLAQETIFAITLSLDELLTNTCSYGYDDTETHTIEVTLIAGADLVTVTLEDDARAFNPLEREAPDVSAALDDRAIGGLGIHLVKSMMDSVRYERRGGQNFVTLEKRLQPSPNQTRDGGA